MKEHRTKALRVTTTNSIQSKDEPDLFGSLQLLQLELSFGSQSPTTTCLGDQWYQPEERYGASSRVLQECLSCGNVPMSALYISANLDNKSQEKGLSNCCCTTAPKLCSSNHFSNSPLHSILTGNLEAWPAVLEEIEKLVKSTCDPLIKEHSWLNWTDSDGNTALLVGGQRLLKEGAYDRAADLVALLLRAGCDPNVKNMEGRSLLSYSVQYMDDSLHLTRLLLNSGASVWPTGGDAAAAAAAEESGGVGGGCSVFTWFLRGVMRRRRLDPGCHETLSLLAQVMAECPHKMHAHVMRTMFKHAKCYRVLGPVFLQMKLAMASYWAQPQQLQFLCRRVIRHSLISPTLTPETVAELGLPPKVQSYIMLQ